MSRHWGYGLHNGPDKWAELGFPLALEGRRQSPVDIDPDAAVPVDEADGGCDELPPLEYEYTPDDALHLENTGHTIKAVVAEEGSLLMGGPLPCDQEYELAQFHFHWGSHNEQGSEHTVGGRSFAAECHFVHWNRSRFASLEEAAGRRKGLAVLSVLIEYVVRDNIDLVRILLD